MTAQTNKKNSSIKKRLVPATAMLVASAMALASSTYAWFTMSREVEVKNIQMTATVPEDIQISLGHLYKDADTDATTQADASLFASTGVLHGNKSADNCGVDAPSTDWDWSNTADISAYYQIGKLIPASSQTGADIFFTPDADGVGKTVKKDAKYFK
ncbi:MAG: hypothetical protein IKP69_02210, partial [Oscillospiraceae bacterium]|nr:hypothetical protein [Oscillospiraceae bacterium]